MESVIFKYSDFFKDDGGFDKALKKVDEFGVKIVESAKKTKTEFKKALDLSDVEGIQRFEKQTEMLTKAFREQKTAKDSLTKAQKAYQAARAKEEQSTKKSSKAITAETEALKKRNREARLVANIQNTTTGSIENLRAKLALVTVSWSKLTAKELENTKRGQRLVESKKQLNAELLKLEKRTGDSRRQVGAYEKGLGKLRGSFMNLSSAMGVSLGLFGAFRLIKNVTSIVRDFEKQNATLAGVLQKTKGEISALTEDAKRLGTITVKTAGEVAGLQTEYARLGFSQEQILQLTEATIEGSLAMNSELSATAQLVGAVVNSYDGLSASDAPMIIDTLSLATAKSALNFESLSVALPIVLGAANALDVPLTEVTATLGKLSDAGIDTSSGATALRNIFIESADRGIDYKKALLEITNSTDKLKTANDLFGKRAAVSALVIANNTENVAELDLALQDAAGTAKEMAEKELNTLDGSLKLLTSAWEGFVLNLNDASNGGNILSNAIRSLAENLDTIFKVIGVATSAWIAYSVAVWASNLATKANIVWTNGASLATNLKTAATTAATAAQNAFNTAVKANPLGLIIALLAAAVTAYYVFRDSVTAAQKAQMTFDESRKTQRVIEEKQIKEEKKISNERIKNLEYEIKLRKAKGEDGKKLDAEFIKRKKEILISEIENNQKIIDAEREKEKEFKKGLDKRTKEIDETFRKASGSIKEGTGETQAAFEKRVAKAKQEALLTFKTQQGAIVETIELRNKEIQAFNEQLIDSDKNLTVQMAENTKVQKKELEKRIKELALLRRRLEDLNDGFIVEDQRREVQQIRRKYDREIQAIKGQSKVEIDLRKALERQKQIEIAEIVEKYQGEKEDMIRRAQEIERELFQTANEKRISDETENTKKLIDEILKNEEITLAEQIKLIEKANQDLVNFKKNVANEQLLRELEDRKLIADARVEQRRGEFASEKEYEDFKNSELIKIQRDYLNERIELLSKFTGDKYKVEVEQLKGELANLVVPPPIDEWKSFANELKEVFTLVGIEVEKAMQRSVESSKKQLDDQQKAVDNQRERAEKGLTNTLAFEQREQGKRESELLKRQKRLEQIQKAKSYWETYNANVSSLGAGEDSSKAIVKTLRDIAIMTAITSSFKDGGITGIDGVKTNRFGITGGKAHDKNGMGGNLAWHEKGEGFLPKQAVDNMGHETFYKIREMALNGNIDSNFFSGQRKDFIQTTNMVVNDPGLKNEMRQVREAVERKPVSNWNVSSIANGTMKLVEETLGKNSVKRNNYIIKKPRP